MNIEAICQGISKGEECAFNCFFESYSEKIYFYLLSTAKGDETCAKEVRQEVFLKVIKHIKPFHSETEFQKWLFAITKNALMDHFRKQSRHSQNTTSFNEGIDFPADFQDDILLESLEMAIEKLTEEQSELVRERYYNGKTYSELSVMYGSTEKALSMKLSRIKDKLREYMLGWLKK